MNKNVVAALDNVMEAYSSIAEFAKDTADKFTQEADALIESIRANISNMSDHELQETILKLATLSYSFAEVKEHNVLKGAIAESMRKEAYASNFNAAEGSVAVRENLAVINSSGEIVADEICQSVASILKTKSDELHRVVDALKTVLLARMSEAKRMAGLNSGVFE